MPTYCVSTEARANGEHEVHDLTPGACDRLPGPFDREHLGLHQNCSGAVAVARLTYRTAIGCLRCCPACHDALVSADAS